MIVLVCGGRWWTNVAAIRREILKIRDDPSVKDLHVIHGGAKGADSIAGELAIELGIPCESFPADWTKYGKGAGPVRNQQMLDKKPDLVLAFHENIASSRGTRDMITRARSAGVLVKIFKE